MNYKVIMTSPRWHLNGVNAFSANLVRGLLKRGIGAKILLTQIDRPEPYETKEMPKPTDVPFETLYVQIKDKRYWESHWNTIIDYLEEEAPCIYIPNYDLGHSCVSPKLSDRVQIVGIVHSDDPWHYEHVCRLGRYWNAIVAVSKTVSDVVKEFDQTFSKRLFTIPYGIHIPSDIPERPRDINPPIKLVYTGRLIQHQKRILDIPKIVELLLNRRVPFELTIIGSGPEEQKLLNRCESLIKQNTVKFLGTIAQERVYGVLAQNDVFVLTSEFEGTPISLLEAMAQGCVPVVTDIRSGIPELVQDGVNGYRVPVGDIKTFADRIAKLQSDVNLRQEMSLRTYSRVKNGGYSNEDMIQSYIELFQHVLDESKSGRYRRPKGEITPPPFLQISPDYLQGIFNTWSWRITTPLRWFGRLLLKMGILKEEKLIE